MTLTETGTTDGDRRRDERGGDGASLELAAQIRSVVAPLSRALRQQIGGLTATQLSVLGSISRHGPARMSDLAAREQLSAPMITKVVDALERHDLVVRSKDPADGRAYRVALSEHGHEWLAESRERRDRWLAERLARLDDADLTALAAALPILDRLVGDQ